MTGHAPIGTIAATARPEQEDCRQRDPAAHRVHHNRASEVMKWCTEPGFDQTLHPKIAVPGNALEERVDQTHKDQRGQQLRVELGALGDTTGDDGRDCGRKGEQEEELDQLITVLLLQCWRAGEKINAVGDPKADKKVADRRDCEVAHDLRQGVDLILRAYGTNLKERKARVHREHHDGADQQEEDVGTRLQLLHSDLLVVHM